MFLDKVIWHSQQAVNGQITRRRSMDINVEQISNSTNRLYSGKMVIHFGMWKIL